MNLFLSIPVELSASPVSSMSPAFQEIVSNGSSTYTVILSILFVLFIFSVCIGMVVLWIWCLVNLLSSKVKSYTEKLLWFLVIFCLPFLGPIIYLFIGKDKVKNSNPKKLKK